MAVARLLLQASLLWTWAQAATFVPTSNHISSRNRHHHSASLLSHAPALGALPRNRIPHENLFAMRGAADDDDEEDDDMDASAMSIRIQYMATFVIAKSIALMVKRANERDLDQDVASLFDEEPVVQKKKPVQEKKSSKSNDDQGPSSLVSGDQDSVKDVTAISTDEATSGTDETSDHDSPVPASDHGATKFRENLTYPIRLPSTMNSEFGKPLPIELADVPPLREPVVVSTKSDDNNTTPSLGVVPVHEGIKELKSPLESTTVIEEGASEPLLESKALEEVSPEEAVNPRSPDGAEHIHGSVPVQEGIKELKKPQNSSTAIELEKTDADVSDDSDLSEVDTGVKALEEVSPEEAVNPRSSDGAEHIHGSVPVQEGIKELKKPQNTSTAIELERSVLDETSDAIEDTERTDELLSVDAKNESRSDELTFPTNTIKLPDDDLESILADIDSLKDANVSEVAVGDDAASNTSTSGSRTSARFAKNSGRLQASASGVAEAETEAETVYPVDISDPIDKLADNKGHEASKGKEEERNEAVGEVDNADASDTIEEPKEEEKNETVGEVDNADASDTIEEPKEEEKNEAVGEVDSDTIKEPAISEETEAPPLSRAERMAEAKKQPKSEEEEARLSKKYGAMDLPDRAYAILYDLGMI